VLNGYEKMKGEGISRKEILINESIVPVAKSRWSISHQNRAWLSVWRTAGDDHFRLRGWEERKNAVFPEEWALRPPVVVRARAHKAL